MCLRGLLAIRQVRPTVRGHVDQGVIPAAFVQCGAFPWR